MKPSQKEQNHRIAERAFKDNWLDKENSLNITKSNLIQLLRIAAKSQLFQFEGNLSCKQVDRIAVSSPLGPHGKLLHHV